MSEPARNLRLVDGNGELHPVDSALADLEDRCAGYKKTIEGQARQLGAAERRLRAMEDPAAAPNGEIVALIDLWRVGIGKPKAVIGVTRIKIVRARIRDGFPISSTEPEATLELAIIGLCSHPYESYGRRSRTGPDSDLKNDLSDALKDERRVEQMARLGWVARRAGWELGVGWPNTPPDPKA